MFVSLKYELLDKEQRIFRTWWLAQLSNHRMYRNIHNNYQKLTRRKILEEACRRVVVYCGHVCVIRCYAWCNVVSFDRIIKIDMSKHVQICHVVRN